MLGIIILNKLKSKNVHIIQILRLIFITGEITDTFGGNSKLIFLFNNEHFF